MFRCKVAKVPIIFLSKVVHHAAKNIYAFFFKNVKFVVPTLNCILTS